jgi:hypothetical protein
MFGCGVGVAGGAGRRVGSAVRAMPVAARLLVDVASDALHAANTEAASARTTRIRTGYSLRAPSRLDAIWLDYAFGYVRGVQQDRINNEWDASGLRVIHVGVLPS